MPAHYGRYTEISRQVNAIYLDYTDLVDPFGIDESFLDLTGSMHLFPMTPRELADTLRARVRQEIGITISVGVSFCRALAKLGSDYKKPDATTVMDRESYQALAYPLPVGDLLFAGRRTVEALRRQGILTIGDLARADRRQIVQQVGEIGDTLWRYANGLDHEPVRSYYEQSLPKSIGNGMTFRQDISGREAIRAGLSALTDFVAERLRAQGLKCTVVQVQVKDPDFHVLQRQCTRAQATWLRGDIIEDAMRMIGESRGFHAPVRALTVTAAGLVPEGETAEQLSMFADAPGGASGAGQEKREAVERTLGQIRERFGRGSIHMGFYPDGELYRPHARAEKGETSGKPQDMTPGKSGDSDEK